MFTGKRALRRQLSAIGLAVFALAEQGRAQTYWMAATGDWFNAANWSAGIPTSTSQAIIDNGGTAEISTGQAAAEDLYLGDSAGASGSVMFSGGTLAANQISVGTSGGTGAFVFSGGTAQGITSAQTDYSLGTNGALNVLANVTTGNITGSGALTVSNGAKLTLAPNSGRSTVNSLNVATGSTLDLTNNGLAINYGQPSADPEAAINAALTSGAAVVNGYPTWTGTGITSSTAAMSVADPSLFGEKAYLVGWTDGNVSYAYHYSTTLRNQILIKYAVAGDAFLENSVGFHDLLVVGQDYLQTGMTYSEGNFFYNADGSVGFADLLAIAQSNQQSFELQASSGEGENTLPLDLASPNAAAVPEPGSLAVAALVGLLMARRRCEPERV